MEHYWLKRARGTSEISLSSTDATSTPSTSQPLLPPPPPTSSAASSAQPLPQFRGAAPQRSQSPSAIPTPRLVSSMDLTPAGLQQHQSSSHHQTRQESSDYYSTPISPNTCLAARFSPHVVTHWFGSLAILLSLACKIWSLVVFFARILVEVQVYSGKDKVTDLFKVWLIDFSFPQMTRDFWTADARTTALIIVMGSAVLPIARHIFMLWAWLAPMNSPGKERLIRNGLMFFEQTGKTAFVDVFFQGYVTCIFYTSTGFESRHHLGGGVLLTGQPVRGLFFGVASTISAAVINHALALILDAVSGRSSVNRVTVGAGPPAASLLRRLWAGSSSLVSKTTHTVIITGLIAICGVVLGYLFAGAVMVSFEMEGLAGLVAGDGWRDFDVFSVPRNMSHKTQEVTGANVLSLVYLGLIVVTPCLVLLVTLLLWVMPAHLETQRVAILVYPFLFSWCSLDVLLLTTVAAYFDMHLIAKFTFDDKFVRLCEEVNKVLGMPCVELGRSIGPGLTILAIAVVGFYALFVAFMQLANRLLASIPHSDFSGVDGEVWPPESPHWWMWSGALGGGSRRGNDDNSSPSIVVVRSARSNTRDTNTVNVSQRIQAGFASLG